MRSGLGQNVSCITSRSIYLGDVVHCILWFGVCTCSTRLSPSNSPAGKEKAGSSSGSLGKETPGKVKVVVPITRYVIIHL